MWCRVAAAPVLPVHYSSCSSTESYNNQTQHSVWVWCSRSCTVCALLRAVPIEYDSMRKFCSRGITSRCGWWFDVLPPPPSLRRAVPFVFGFLFDGRPTNRPTDDVSLRHTVMEIFEFTNWEESWIVWLGLDGCYLYLEKHNWIGAMCSDKCLWRFARVSRKCPS